MEAYEARTKLIRAKWMINEIKDMVKDRSSRDEVIEFIEKMSKDFEI
jgi:fatty acid-binding protein DegV